MSERTRYAFLVRDRQQGKSSTLVAWVAEGEPLDDLKPAALMRSDRALLVPNERRKQELLRRWRPILQGRIFSIQDLATARGIDFSRTEFAVDDTEELILDSLPPYIADQVTLLAMTGNPDPTIADALQWALDHTREEIQARLDEIRPEPNLFDSLS